MTQSFPPPNSSIINALPEFLLSCAVAAALMALAQPLASLPLEALGSRYAVPTQTPSGIWLWEVWRNSHWDALGQDIRALALHKFSGCMLAATALLGWLGLQGARRSGMRGGALAFACWAVLAWLLRPFQWPGAVWIAVTAAAAMLLLLPVRRVHQAEQAGSSTWTAFVWPGWILFCGVGCLQVIDFAARGPVVPGGLLRQPAAAGARYFGLQQLDGLWLAVGLFLLVVATRRPILQFIVAFFARLPATGARQRLLRFAVPCLIVIAMGWLGYFPSRDFLGVPGLRGGGKPHVSGEALRLMAWLVIAWLFYRWNEWESSRPRLLAGILLAAAGLAACTAGFVLSDDKGPMLVIALSGVVIGPSFIAMAVGRRWGMHVCAAVTAAFIALGIAAWHTGMVKVLPQVSKQAGQRAEMRAQPFANPSSANLAQALWLMAFSPRQPVNRLTLVPWCGAAAYMNLARCTLASGAPIQMPSDLGYVMLTATWGAAGAAGWLLLLLAWLAALPLGQLRAWNLYMRAGMPGRSVAARRLDLLPVWMVAVAVAMAIAQVLVSAGAALAWLPLAGVTFPLYGFGGTALCSTAIWTALAAHNSPLAKQPQRRPQTPRARITAFSPQAPRWRA